MSRDRSGRLKALLPLDGATIKPVIDPWGGRRSLTMKMEACLPRCLSADSKRVSGNRLFDARPDLSATQSTRQSRLWHEPRRAGRDDGEYCLAPTIIPSRLFLRRKYSRQPDRRPRKLDTGSDRLLSEILDAYFDGDLSRRRRAKFVPGGVAKTFIQTKEPELKGPFDEWLARIVCFAFSISPQALTQTVNRATAETQKSLPKKRAWRHPCLGEGTHRRYNRERIRRARSRIRLEHRNETDPVAQEAVLSGYTSKGILTINEARAALGRAPLAEASANKAMTLTNAGFVGLPE